MLVVEMEIKHGDDDMFKTICILFIHNDIESLISLGLGIQQFCGKDDGLPVAVHRILGLGQAVPHGVKGRLG